MTAAAALALSVVAIAGTQLRNEHAQQPDPRPTVVRAPHFVQAGGFSTGRPIDSTTLALSRAVARGDLLVGWFAEYGGPGPVRVSDGVNGAWTRAERSLTFQNDAGDIALYYRENSLAAPLGVEVTVSAAAATYLEGSAAEYSGVALAGSMDRMAVAWGVGTTVDTGPTASVARGDLVFAAVVTGRGPVGVSGGRSRGARFSPRSNTPTGAAYAQDILSSGAGSQKGTASLSSATDWYAVCVAFRRLVVRGSQPPAPPAALRATSTASTRVTLSWPASTSRAGVTGYTVYRDGTTIGTVGPGTPWFTDPTTLASTAYRYTVDAFDAAGRHSARSSPSLVRTPARSAAFVQGAAMSPGRPLPSVTLSLPGEVGQGDLLVGWFGQYGADGQVQVSDSVNGPWTRSVSERFSNGTGDLALYYRENSAPAPSGLVITVSASAPAYLQEVVAEFRNVRPSGALHRAVAASGSGTASDSGPTGSVARGELVVASVITGCQPGSDTPGASQSVPFVIDEMNGSGSTALADILSSAGGPQRVRFTIHASCDWYTGIAAFRT